MYANELFESPHESLPGTQTDKDDNSVMKLSDLRKTRLTLAHLNRLRMANDVRQFEMEKKNKTIKTQYAPAPDTEAAMGGAPMPGM